MRIFGQENSSDLLKISHIELIQSTDSNSGLSDANARAAFPEAHLIFAKFKCLSACVLTPVSAFSRTYFKF